MSIVQQKLTSKATALTVATVSAFLFTASPQLSIAEGLQLEEVVVTARKREENLQNIPVAATVLTAAALEARSATDVADITASVPNVSYQDRAGGHQTSIGIRGIASNVRNIGLEDSVGVYVDGVYIGRPMFYNIDLAEVQQIEILRGPQGTLFGKNTIAGALNITSKAVPESFEGKVTASIGDYGLRYVKGYVGGMFTDTVGGSLSIVSKKTDGYMDNLFDGSELQAVDQQGVAGKLQIQPSDGVNIVISADYSEKDNDVNGSQIIVPGGAGLGLDFGDGVDGIFGEQYGPFTVNEDGPQKYEEEVSGFAVTADFDLANDFTLTAIAAVRQMDLVASFDDDNSPVDGVNSVFTDEAEQSSLELRLASPGDQTFDWLFGVFYFDQEVDSNRHTQAFGALDVFGIGTVETTSMAAYFSGDYHFTDRLDLNIGLRYTRDEKEALWNQSGSGTAAFGLPVITLEGDETWNEVSPTLALTYAISDDASVYGKVSRGFKGGGFMTDLVGEVGFQLEPETVTSYEVGLKSTLVDGRLRLNAAAFVADYEDLQTLDLAGLQFVGANAGQATLQGIEVDFEFLATEALKISGGLGFTDSEYDEFLQNVNGTINDLSGNTLSNAPELTASVLIDYVQPISDYLEIRVSADVSFKDDIHYSVTNDPVALGDSYTLANARIGVAQQENQWNVALWVKNLADEEYFTFLRNGPFGQQTGLFGEPRTYGIDVTYNF